jgi:hypothetical protein
MAVYFFAAVEETKELQFDKRNKMLNKLESTI